MDQAHLAMALPSAPMAARIPWRQIVAWSLLGTAITTAMVVISCLQAPLGLLDMVRPGDDGPSAAVVQRDFPNSDLAPGIGHDGQQFYAVARDPLHPGDASPALDRPRYRLQRIAYPLVAGLAYPGVGGTGLLMALLAVGVVALLVGSLATGALGVSHGAPPWIAVVFGLLPSNMVALRIGTADALALGCAVAAIALAEHRRPGWATGFAVLAALSKEAILVTLVAYALHRRDRAGAMIAGAAVGAVAGWWLWLRLTIDVMTQQVIEFTLPFGGLAESVERWRGGQDSDAAALIVIALLIGVVVAVKFRPSTLWWALVVPNAAFITILSRDATGLWANGSRVAGPTLLFGVLALVTSVRSIRRPDASPA